MRCQRCGRHFQYGHGLTVHHIRPRADGGGDNLGNLITLCTRCHDWVEGRGLRSRAAIMGSTGTLGCASMPPREPLHETRKAGFGYQTPGHHHFWIDGRFYASAVDADVVEIWRYRRFGEMWLEDRKNLLTGVGYWGRPCREADDGR